MQARKSVAGQGKSRRGYSREGVAIQVKAWLGKARRDYSRQGVAMQGKAWQVKAKHG
jgi:hypothetical protein